MALLGVQVGAGHTAVQHLYDSSKSVGLNDCFQMTYEVVFLSIMNMIGTLMSDV